MDPDGDISGEVTRVERIRYLQGATGHAVGSTLFLLLGGLFWMLAYRSLAVVSVAVACLVSANGLSIWAWDRLRAHFLSRAADAAGSDPKRELTVRPLSTDSRVEIQAGAVMLLTVVGLLIAGRFALQFLGARAFGYLCVAVLSAGNVTALARTVRESRP
jgi:hypothetical protein